MGLSACSGPQVSQCLESESVGAEVLKYGGLGVDVLGEGITASQLPVLLPGNQSTSTYLVPILCKQRDE